MGTITRSKAAPISFSDIVDTGTEGTKVAVGTTAQQGTTAGQWRFNSTTGKFEGRNAGSFVALEANPVIASVNSSNITQAQIDADFDLVITGSNFASGDSVKFIANDDTEFISPTTTVNTGSQITARVNSNIDPTKEPYKVQVVSASGLTGTLANAFNIDAKPIYTTASGNIVTTFEGVTVNTSVVATDPENDAITYAVQSGSLPTGLSISSGGVITGTAPNVTGSATSNFTIRATSGTNTTDRAFNIVVGDEPTGGTISTYSSDGVNYRVHQFTSSGSFVFPITSTISILIVAGGGAGGAGTGGGGGAGGLIYIPSYSIVAGTWTCTIGNGGTNDSVGVGTNGDNSVFAYGSRTLTALGGGYGASTESGNLGYASNSGGSGGGGTEYVSGGPQAGSSAIQPVTTSDGENTYSNTGFGNDGGTGTNQISAGWGGGGAGTSPTTTTSPLFTYGGEGKQIDITGTNTYYAAGGQGGSGESAWTNSTNNIGGSHDGVSGSNGVANTGSGGGGGWSHSTGTGGNGGVGIIIIKYVI